MRIIIIFIITIIGTVTSYADKRNDFDRYIEDYDVPREVRELTPGGAPYLFWHTLMENNERFKKFEKKIGKNKGAEKEALNRILEIRTFNPKYIAWIDESKQHICDTLMEHLGMAKMTPDVSLHVALDDDKNAFTALTEESFAMCIHEGLLQSKGFNEKMMIGAIAHEYAHGILMHHLEHEYAYAKRKRRNKLMTGITAGLNAIAAAADSYTFSMLGKEADNDVYVDNIIAAKIEAKKDLYHHVYKYAREQELEADLIAFRFLEYHIGSGEAYIDLLRLLMANSSPMLSYYLYDEDAEELSHPPAHYRIEFLRYVQAHPEKGNKINDEIRKENEKIRKRKEIEAKYGAYP